MEIWLENAIIQHNYFAVLNKIKAASRNLAIVTIVILVKQFFQLAGVWDQS